MTQPAHAPEPLEIPKDHFAGYGDNGENFKIQVDDKVIAIIPARFRVIDDETTEDYLEAQANGRLLAAAYNAFDSAAEKLGCNAIELAESLQDGDIATLVKSLKDMLSRFRSCIAQGSGEIEGDKEAIANAEATYRAR